MSRARWSDDGGSDSGSSALYSDSDRGDGGTRTGDFLRRAPPATTTTTTDAGAGAGAGDDDARVRSRTVRSKAGWGDVTARGSGEKPSRPHLPPDRARRDRGPSSASIIADALGKVVDADDAFHDDVEMARRGAAGGYNYAAADDDERDTTPLRGGGGARGQSRRARAAAANASSSGTGGAARASARGRLDLSSVLLKAGTRSRWAATTGGGEIGAWTARHAAAVADGRATSGWLMVCVLVMFIGGLVAQFWESAGQWSAPQHHLPVATLTAIAALQGGKGVLGSDKKTATLLQLGHVFVLCFAVGVDAWVMTKTREVIESKYSNSQYDRARRIAEGGIAVAMAGKCVALPIAIAHARRVVWPGTGEASRD
jgi:hypothetical protein